MSPTATSDATGRRSDVLEALLRKRGIDVDRKPAPIPRRRGEGPWPCSLAQERMWLSERLLPTGSAYVLFRPARLRGPLDVVALRRTFVEIEARHEALRTTFVARDGEPYQRVRPGARDALCLVDLSTLPEAARERAVERRVAAEARSPFDLEAGPLWRQVLLRLGDEHHVLLLSLHHLVCDGWSMGLLAREWTTLYDGFRRGDPSPLPELPIQYPDFSQWQRRHLEETGVIDEQLAVWRRRLEGAETLLDLPTDRPRPAAHSFRGDSLSFTVPEAPSSAARRLARERGTTLFTLLLAVFHTLLWRYTGQSGFLVGTPVAGRTRPETEDLIGLFVNTLALRGDPGDDPPFEVFLERTGEIVREAQANQDLPFERLVSELRPERSLSHSVLFQTMLLLQNAPGGDLELAGIEIGGVPRSRESSLFDLTLAFDDGDGALAGGAEYSTELFDAATVRRLCGHFVNLLSAAVEAPGTPLGALPILSEAEHRQLDGWQGEPVGAPPPPVHRTILEHARTAPDRVALEQGGRRVTYAELRRSVERLAAHLEALGLAPEAPVAVHLERSPEMMIALLAVLRTGGVYVPLDPEMTAGRGDHMLAEAGHPPVITRPALADGLDPRCTVVDVDAVLAGDGGTDETGPPSPPVDDPRRAAYRLYTSGSTGTPKGVVVEHGALSRFAATTVANFDLGPGDRVLQYMSISFDASVEELWPILVAGGTMVLFEGPAAVPPGRFLRQMEECRVDTMDLPTAYWHELVAWLEEEDAAVPPSLRLAIVGGETAEAAAWERWCRRAGDGVTMVNTYGPTEATCVATFHRSDEEWSGPRVPIGRPLAGVRAEVLDRRLRRVPVGVVGELFLAGVGLARGYHGRPAATAAAFVPDRRAEEPGERTYRTGDLARWLPDGRLDFLGRADRQVKIRSCRVELGEVEAALVAHPGVGEAAVVVTEEAAGGAALAAYAAAPGVDPGALREYLAERLPAFMHPACLRVLDTLPKTASGKVDRRALPRPETVRKGDGGRPPRDGLETTLAELWQEVLESGPLAADDDFFALGGDSLTAMRLLAAVEKELGRELPLAALIQGPTVAEMAEMLSGEETDDGEAGNPVVPLRDPEDAAAPPLVLVHPAGGAVDWYVPLARRLPAGVPALGLQARGLDGDGAPRQRIGAMADAYLAALERDGSAPLRLGGWSAGGLVALEMARRADAGGDASRLLLLDTVPPRDGDGDGHGDAGKDDGDDELTLTIAFARDLGLTGEDFDVTPEEFAALGGDRRLGLVLARAKAAGRLPESLERRRFDRRYDVFRATARAAGAYRPEDPWPGPALLVQASGDPGRDLDDEARRWRRWLPGLWVERLPADHYALLREPALTPLAALVAEHLGADDEHNDDEHRDDEHRDDDHDDNGEPRPR